MIEVKDLTKKYGSHYAIDRLNFNVKSGHIYGFLGPNGAGKSTTMNIIAGCLAATEGTVKINGYDIYKEPIKAKRSIGYLPEFPPLYLDMTPYEYLRFVAEAKEVDRGLVDEKIEQVMKETGITDMQDRLIKNLSKGYRQRVGIAQAMLGDPEVIILDEPTVGLDPKQIIEIRELIKSLGTTHTVILSSHILSEISAVCDYVLIISKGKLVAQDTLENLSAHYTSSATVRVLVSGEEGGLRMAIDTVKDSLTDYTYGYDKDEPQYLAAEITIPRDTDIRARLSNALVENGCTILSMTTESLSLEDVFLMLTQDSHDEDEAASREADAMPASVSDETETEAEDDEPVTYDSLFSAGESEAGLRDDESDDDDEEDMTDEEPDIEALEAAEAEEKAKAEAEMAARLRKKEPPAENQPRKKQDDGEYRSLFTISDDDKGEDNK
ncbi:MAG TPA: ABC transporter ATP-binding protein [Clostridiales bacterium]|nr:ABC transporter ATP-binding protein [Clostridiales bacterium]